MTSPGSFAEGLVGVVLDDRYRLDALLGEGGMGAVYRAQHLAMDRRVAVKLLKPHLTQDATASARFLREARATMKVDSPHAVKVLDFGITPHGDYYMALEYLDGRTVQRELDVDGPFAPARVLHIARQALHALGAAHKTGLVHRDIKPDNILLLKVGDDADYTKLLDFGVAKLMEGTAVSSQSALQLTQAGMVFGTPEFMSPEQACGHPLDGRSDLYSLAATMFAMLTGCALFEGRSPIELLTHHVRTPPPHLEMLQPELAQYPKLDELLQRCLAKKREDRPASADELEQLVAQVQAYVKRGGAAAASARGALRSPSQSSSSSYFQALPADLVEAGATLLPAQPRASSPTIEPPTSSSESRSAITRPERGALRETTDTTTREAEALVPRRRGLALALVGVAALGLVAAAIVLATRTKDSAPNANAPEGPSGSNATVATQGSAASQTGSAEPSPGSAAASTSDPTSAPTSDAGVAHPGNELVDAGAAVVADAAVARPRDGRDRIRDARPTSEHLKAAEAALREGNRLRQLAEADLALQEDPRNPRAKYLLADALIKGGDLDRGCGMLRALGRYPLAIARASAAKCP